MYLGGFGRDLTLLTRENAGRGAWTSRYARSRPLNRNDSRPSNRSRTMTFCRRSVREGSVNTNIQTDRGMGRVKGRAFGSPLARGLYSRASTAEVDPRAKPGASAAVDAEDAYSGCPSSPGRLHHPQEAAGLLQIQAPAPGRSLPRGGQDHLSPQADLSSPQEFPEIRSRRGLVRLRSRPGDRSRRGRRSAPGRRGVRRKSRRAFSRPGRRGGRFSPGAWPSRG